MVIPYFVFATITMLWYWFLAVTHEGSYDFIHTAFLYLLQIRYSPLWFLPCLFVAEILYFPLRKYKPILISISSFGLFLMYRMLIGHDLPWNADLAVLALGFITLAQAVKRLTWIPPTGFVRVGLILLIVAIWLALSYLNYKHYGRIDWYSDSFGNPVIYILAASAGIIITVFIAKLISPSVVTLLGNNSLVFFGFNRIVLDVLYAVYQKVGINVQHYQLPIAMFSIIAAILILIPVHLFILRWMPWALGRRHE